MSWWIGYISYTLGLAVLVALFEIQIEGENGMASKLPTRRWYLKGVVKKIVGVPYITPYHILLISIIFLLLHFYILTKSLSVANEVLLLGTFFVLMVIEDFLWFALHPSPKFGIKNFKKTNKWMWWHTRWLLGVPIIYWILGPIGTALIILSRII